MSKSDKKATSKGKQAEITPSKNAKAASEGNGASAASSGDRKKMFTSTSKGKKADTLAKGHAKSTADRNKAETKNETGMFVLPLSRLRLLYMVGLTLSTVSEAGGLVVSSERRLKPTMRVTDVEPEDDKEEEHSTIHRAFLLNCLMKLCFSVIITRQRAGRSAKSDVRVNKGAYLGLSICMRLTS
jgi:hypothetical protein